MSDTPATDSMPSNSVILITGATGFLGGATSALLVGGGRLRQLRFLVRADTTEEGRARIVKSLSRFDVKPEALADLSDDQIIRGDLGRAADFVDDPRLDTVTHVLNCAAVASFSSNHPGIWPVNVEGTFLFAERMSRVAHLRRFLHVGTAMACGPDATSPVRESWDTPPDEDHLVPYTASKAEIERRIRERLPHLPFVVARPSIVVGDTRFGCAPSASIFWVFRMAVSLEQFACELDERVDVIPVDYCAEALAKLLLAPSLHWRLYHISAGEQSSNTFRSIDAAYAKANGTEPIAPRWKTLRHGDLAGLASQFRERLGDCNRRLVSKAVRLYGSFAGLSFTFDNSRLLAEGMGVSPPFASYIDKCVHTSRGVPIGELMLEDFK